MNKANSGNLTWPEYKQQIHDGAIVFLPIGAFEQHGLHLPLNTDTVVACHIATLVAERLGGMVLPPIEYGAKSLPRSGGGDSFPATTNLDGMTLSSLTSDIVREQRRHGVRRMVLVLGHGENEPFVLDGIEQGMRLYQDDQLQVMVAGWWQFLEERDLLPHFPEGFPGWDREHAAKVETALMLALVPDVVQPVSPDPIDDVVIDDVTVTPHRSSDVPRQGSLSDPRGASAEMGRQLITLITERFTGAIVRRLQV